MTHYRRFHLPMKSLDNTISLWMVSSRVEVSCANQGGEGLEQVALELFSTVGGHPGWATKSGYPARHEGSCAGLRSDVFEWKRLRPPCKAVDGGKAVSVIRRQR